VVFAFEETGLRESAKLLECGTPNWRVNVHCSPRKNQERVIIIIMVNGTVIGYMKLESRNPLLTKTHRDFTVVTVNRAVVGYTKLVYDVINRQLPILSVYSDRMKKLWIYGCAGTQNT